MDEDVVDELLCDGYSCGIALCKDVECGALMARDPWDALDIRV